MFCIRSAWGKEFLLFSKYLKTLNAEIIGSMKSFSPPAARCSFDRNSKMPYMHSEQEFLTQEMAVNFVELDTYPAAVDNHPSW
jgi:hypothetical protein